MINKFLEKLGTAVLEGIQVISASLIIIVIIHVLIATPQQVKGQSMYPTLHDKDRIITEKITYKTREPKRQEIIVFKYPLNTDIEYIKRVIGLPGEKIQIRKNKIYIFNEDYPKGFILKEPYLSQNVITRSRRFLQEGKLVTIPENKYVVMGDNRDKSSDSREWGFVDKSLIVGRTVFRYWPPKAFGIIKNPNPEENIIPLKR